MSTETQPLRLVPFTRKADANGVWVLEPGDQQAIELPNAYQPLIEAIERGTTLAKLADIVTPLKNGSRFQALKKFLIYLDDHELLADRDYRRLADSLRTEYTWPTSVLTTPIASFKLANARRRQRSTLVVALGLFATLALFAFTIFMNLVADHNLESEVFVSESPSLLRTLILFIASFSLARCVVGAWGWVVGAFDGSIPELTLVFEPISIRIRQEQSGRAVRGLTIVSLIFTLFLAFGAGAFLSGYGQTSLEATFALLGATLAFFTETSPYSRSSLTDILRSFYATSRAKQVSTTGKSESAIRRVHITASFAWVLFLGLFLALDGFSEVSKLWGQTRFSEGRERVAGFALIAVFLMLVVNWLADIFGSMSYDNVTTGQIRRLWRRRNESALERVQGVTPSAQDLEKLPFLRQIPAEVRQKLLLAAQVRSFRDGQLICQQGQTDRNLFVVLEGKLAVAKNHPASGGRTRRKIVAWLEPGAVFGENSFFFARPRSADVVGMEAGRVLILPHTREMNLVDTERSSELRTRIWFLQALVQNQLFKDLPSEALDSILHAGAEQAFKAGTKVIQEGEDADACYFMVQGRAAVTQKTQSIGKINAGDAFGEISILFPGTLRTATVVAETDLLTIKIERDRFWKLLRSHLTLALEVERLGLRRLRIDQARSVKN